MAFFITQTHKWKLLQLRPRSNVRSSTYRLYPHVLRLCVVLLRVLVITATMIRKTWTIFQKIYFSLTTCWKKKQRKNNFEEKLSRTSYNKKGSEGPQSENKFIVFFSCLMQLFEFCPLYTEPSTSEVSNVVGTLIHVTQKCLSCSYAHVWRSQPYIKKIPAGNLLLSAAIPKP